MDWIDEDEKYALIGLNVNVERNVRQGLIAPGLSVVTGSQFQVPPLWKEWLGTLRVEEVETANLFLITKIKSEQPDILDEENQSLQRLVSRF